jgi:hypothetical protein
MKRELLLIGLLLFVFLCFSCFHKEDDCNLSKPSKIISIQGKNNEKISYKHLVLVEGLDKRCLDSITGMRIVDNYIKSQDKDLPIRRIQLFNSIDNFDQGETLSQPKSFYGDCLVEILLDTVKLTPIGFTFYSSSGMVTYEGSSWKKL